MKMKKTLLWIVAVILSMSLIATFSLAGCEKAGEAAEEAAEEVTEAVEEAVEEVTEEVEEVEEKAAPGTYTMKIGHSHGTDMPRHLSLLFFEQLVEKNSEGAIDVEVYPGGQLGTEAEMTESVKMGTLEGTRGGSFDIVAKKLVFYQMPFLFADIDDFVAIARGPIGDEIAEQGLEEGVAILATGDAGGFRQWTNNVRPLLTPEDVEGLKIRTPPIESLEKIWAALGANPVSIAYAELYMSLKTGVADGQENPIVNIYDKKFYEVQKYMTYSNYQIHPDPFFVSAAWLDELPEYLYDIVVDAAKESMKYSDTLMKEKEEAVRDTVEAGFDQIDTLTADQKAVFIDMCDPVYDYFIDEGWITQDLLDRAWDQLAE
jgi:tripartite ATP-independent transporter DctP family solute receptor